MTNWGFVSDISKKGRVIMTATTNGSLGLADDGDHFIDGYDKNTLGFEKADGNSDENVTMLELYNYAINQNSSTYHRHQYDDNGDGNSQQNKITSTLNGDGCTGSRMTINGWADSNQNIVGPINSSVTKDATIVDITNSTISNNSTVQVHSKQSTITNTQVNIGSVLIIDNNVCQ